MAPRLGRLCVAHSPIAQARRCVRVKILRCEHVAVAGCGALAPRRCDVEVCAEPLENPAMIRTGSDDVLQRHLFATHYSPLQVCETEPPPLRRVVFHKCPDDDVRCAGAHARCRNASTTRW